MPGLYDSTLGLSDGTGLWRGRLGLFSGASGFINGSGGAYVDLYFSAGTYSVAGNGYTTLGSIPGFTFTRASLAMGYDATGKLTYGPNNLLLQSQTFGTTWSQNNGTVTSDSAVAPDGTTTADSFVASSSANAYIRQSITTLAGTSYVGSVYIKAAVNSWALVEFWNSGTVKWSGTYINLSTGAQGSTTTGGGGLSPTFTITSAGNGWYRLSAAVTTDNAALSMNIYLASGNGNLAVTAGNSIYLWGAQLEAVTYQTTPSTYYPTTTAAYYGPRLVYDPVTLASQGILVEEARTNLCLQSQDFATTWATSRSSVTVNTTTSPDGTSNADKLVEDNTAGGHQLTQTITTTAVATTISVYAKPAGRDWIALGLIDSGAAGRLVYFNVSTGAVGTVGTGFTASIQAVGNGWYRCIATLSAAFAGANTLRVYVTTGDGVTSYTGDGTSGAFIYQAQLEAGQGASSPIPTTTASVTRAADVPSLTGLTVRDGCSVVFEGITPSFVSTDARVSLTDGSTSNRLFLLYDGSNGYGQRTVGGATSSVVNLALGAGVGIETAMSSAGGAVRGSINGGSVAGITGTALPTLTEIQFNSGGGVRFWNGTISRIRVYNRALSDAELQAITQSLLLQEDGYSILQEDNSYIWLE